MYSVELGKKNEIHTVRNRVDAIENVYSCAISGIQ